MYSVSFDFETYRERDFAKVSDRSTFLVVSWPFLSFSGYNKVKNALKTVEYAHGTFEPGRNSPKRSRYSRGPFTFTPQRTKELLFISNISTGSYLQLKNFFKWSKSG